mmetsp:Transcript_2167/g.5656  ORF Transcript_2167/g.5656 Transcript_2167/m.5656 type:complete len:221 (-) Transcript_2167:1119-1781(-)
MSSSSEMWPSPLRSSLSKARLTSFCHLLPLRNSGQSSKQVANSSNTILPSLFTSMRVTSCCTSVSDKLYPCAISPATSSSTDTSPEPSSSSWLNMSRNGPIISWDSSWPITSVLFMMSSVIMLSTYCFRWPLTAKRCSLCTTVPLSGAVDASPPSFTHGCCRASRAVMRFLGSTWSSFFRRSTAAGATPSFSKPEKSIFAFAIMSKSSFMLGALKLLLGQ